MDPDEILNSKRKTELNYFQIQYLTRLVAKDIEKKRKKCEKEDKKENIKDINQFVNSLYIATKTLSKLSKMSLEVADLTYVPESD